VALLHCCAAQMLQWIVADEQGADNDAPAPSPGWHLQLDTMKMSPDDGSPRGPVVAFRGFVTSFRLVLSSGTTDTCLLLRTGAVIVVTDRASDHAILCQTSTSQVNSQAFQVLLIAYDVGMLRVDVRVSGVPAQLSPFAVRVLPSSEATFGCVRPGVSSLLYRQFGLGEMHVPWTLQQESINSSRSTWTTVTEVEDNLLEMTNVCLHEKRLHLFRPNGSSHRSTITILSHAWGMLDEKTIIQVQEHAGEDFRTFSQRTGAMLNPRIEVDGGHEHVYIFPEGPTSHVGHMIYDTVLTLFATMDAVGDTRERKHVVLWPNMFFLCPVKGPSVHSRRYWDLFAAVTVDPQQNIRFLAEVFAESRGTALCFHRAIVGQVVHRAMKPGNLVPFAVDIPAAVVLMRRNLGLAPHFPARPYRDDLSGFSAHAAPVAIVISRMTRGISNDAALLDLLRKKGFRPQVASWTGMPLKQQLEILGGTSILVGTQGSDLCNAMYLPERAAVVDILPYCWQNTSDFWQITEVKLLRHYAWRNPDAVRSSCPSGCLCPSSCPRCIAARLIGMSVSPGTQCVVPSCGHDPPPDRHVAAGTYGGDDVSAQNTEVDLDIMDLIFADAFAFLADPKGRPAGGPSATGCNVVGKEVRCFSRHPGRGADGVLWSPERRGA